MENENNENIDSSIDEQNETVETNETTLTVDDYNRVAAELEAEKAKNAKLYARISKKSSDNKPLVNAQSDTSQVTQELARLKLQVNHGISDPDAIEFIMKNGGEKALENPYIKGALESITQQKKAENAVISEESGKSEVFKKHTPAELKAMSSEDLEKLLPHV